MPEPLDEPIRKISLNIYEADYQEMKRRYGWGWTELVREWIRQHLRQRREENEYDR